LEGNLNIKNELYRKLIHISSTVIPVLYYFTSKELILGLVGTGTILMLLLDILKAYSYFFENLYRRGLNFILREEEKDFRKNLFTGGTYYAIGIFLSLLVFPKEVAIFSILIMVWCDTMAALFGKKFGVRKIVGNKTVIGSTAFFITGIVLVLFLHNIFPDYGFYKTGFITVLFAMVFEQIGFFNVNDNLSLPLFSGVVFLILNNII